MTRRHGITRTAFLSRRWAVKVPSLRYRNFTRGWLANRSEWQSRHAHDVNPVILTLGYVANVYRRAERIATPEEVERHCEFFYCDGDEAKHDSWGWFAGQMLLVDYDRAHEHPRGWVGSRYYAKQERMVREWAAADRERVGATVNPR